MTNVIYVPNLTIQKKKLGLFQIHVKQPFHFALFILFIVLESFDQIVSDLCHIGKSVTVERGGDILDERRSLIVEVALIIDVGKRLHYAFPIDLAVIGQGVGVAVAVVVVNVGTAVNESGSDRADSLCGVNALEQAVSDVEADGEHGIAEGIKELVESFWGRCDRNSADILDRDLDAALARNGDELFIEIEVVFKQYLGIALDREIKMSAGVNDDHRRAEIRRVSDALNDLLESICRLILLNVA